MTSVDTVTQWREDWPSTSVVNHTIVIDPTIRQPSFDLPRHTWSLMNRFRTGQSQCRANLHKRGLAQSPSCDCGQRETMNHTVDTCQLTKFDGGLDLLSALWLLIIVRYTNTLTYLLTYSTKRTMTTVIWLESTATAAHHRRNHRMQISSAAINNINTDSLQQSCP